MPKGKWIPLTADQEKYILDNYDKLPVKRLAAHAGITFGRVMRLLDKKGLKISPEVKQRNIAAGRYSKGRTAFNKGKKQTDYMSQEAIERTKATRFQKGNTPHNTLADGVVTQRADSSGYVYKYIRISLGNWELYHRWLWKQTHGEIPEDYHVIFKDNNSQNCVIENLKCISIEEHMLRNSKMQYNREVVPSMALVRQLEKKVQSFKQDTDEE